MTLPPEKQALLERIRELLAPLPGVAALVLGGSYARGAQRPDSDLDIGIYYHADRPFAIAAIQQVAAALAPGTDPRATDFYGWGAWVNGGAWIHTPSGKVDFIYRSLEQVRQTILEARQGRLSHDYPQQPVFGFSSQIYLAETRVCLPFYDPQGEIRALKALVADYPPALKDSLVNGSLWLAEFTLLHADGYAARGDVYTTGGALSRTAYYLTQALFALNETYFMNDKTALAEIAAFTRAPADFGARLSAILGRPGFTPEELQAAAQAMRALWSDVVALTAGAYRPAFRV